MVSFEKFRPQLRNGRIIPQGDRLVFETEVPFDQIIFPIEMIDFLSQCNGELTIADIIENIYHRQGTVQFKAIYRTLMHLRDRGFLENGEELKLPNNPNHSDVEFLSFKPLWTFYLGRRIINDGEQLTAFYILSMLICSGAILCFQNFSAQWLSLDFLRAGGSYLNGLAFFVIGSSVLLSTKHFTKCILLLFLTGRAYNFGMTFNGFALYFRVTSDSLFLVTNKLFKLVFHVATTLCYFPLVGLIYAMVPSLQWQTEAYSLAVILTMLEINPFQDNEITQFFKSLFNDDTLNRISKYWQNRPLISVVNPFDHNRKKNLFLAFTYYSAAWSFSLFYLFYYALRFHFDSSLGAVRLANTSEKVAAFIGVSLMAALAAVTLYNIGRILQMALLAPIAKFINNITRGNQSRKVDFFNTGEVQRVVETLPLFSYFSDELLKVLINRSEVRQFRAGTPVIVQGDPGTHLYVLLSGALEVRQRQPNGAYRKLGEVMPPSVFGEIAVLDETIRTAEVTALHESIALLVPAKLLRDVSQDSQYIRELNAFKNAIIVNQYFTSAPIFKDLKEDVIHFCMSRGKIETYKKDQIVFKQNDAGDGFYLLLRGSVGVLVNGRPTARIQQGGFFGEISMIADIARTGTVYALEDMQVFKLSRETFWEMLAKDISVALFVEAVGEMRIREDVEVFKIDGKKQKKPA